MNVWVSAFFLILVMVIENLSGIFGRTHSALGLAGNTDTPVGLKHDVDMSCERDAAKLC